MCVCMCVCLCVCCFFVGAGCLVIAVIIQPFFSSLLDFSYIICDVGSLQNRFSKVVILVTLCLLLGGEREREKERERERERFLSLVYCSDT